MEETRLQPQLDAFAVQLKEHRKLVQALLKASTACSKGAEAGDLKKLTAGLGQIAEATQELGQAQSQLRWNFNFEEYIDSGVWRFELIDMLAAEGVRAADSGRSVVAPPFEVTGESGGLYILGKRAKTSSPLRIAEFLAQELRKPPARDFVKSVSRAVRHLDRGSAQRWSAKLRDVFDVLSLSEEFRSEYPDERGFLVELLRMYKTPESERPKSLRYQFDMANSSVHPRDILEVRGPSGEALRFFKLLVYRD